MTTKPATPAQAPVTLWETFEGETFGYSDSGARIIEITARTRATAWSNASNIRGWVALDENHHTIARGTADGLRAARAAALAALKAHNADGDAPRAPRKGTKVQVNATYPSSTFRGRRGKVESSARGDDGQLYVTVDLGTQSWPFLVTELDAI